MQYNHLFSPIDIGPIHIKNRIFMSPMHPNLSESPNGHYTKRYIAYFQERAKNGVGLIMTGHVKAERNIDPYPCAYKFPCLDKNDEIKYFKELTEAVHLYGAKIAVELSAGTGRIADSLVDGYIPGSASSVPMLYMPNIKTRELTKDEIKGLVKAYGVAAANAKKAGFDIIYVHASAYLLDQFLTPAWNHRTDEYGGSIENRMRFMMECIDSARAAVGDRFPLIAGFSMEQGIPDGKTEEDCIAIAKALEDKGILALHVRDGAYDTMNLMIPSNMNAKQICVDYAAKIKAAVHIPVLADGALLTPDVCESVISDGKLDMAGIGRPLLADPEWIIKAREGRLEDIRPCLRCMECLNRVSLGLYSGCSVNPVMGREYEGSQGKTQISKNVLVIGGGQAGALAALYASQRGHHVTLAESSDNIGGHMLEGSMPSFKSETRVYLEWIKHQLEKSDIDVRTGVVADKAFVDGIHPDAVIVATGSKPTKPPVPGIDNANVRLATDVLRDGSGVGQKVVIIGAGLVGCETAIALRQAGKDVTLVEMLPNIGQEIIMLAKFPILKSIFGSGIVCKTDTALQKVTDTGVVVMDKEKQTEEIPADTVIIATGLKSENALYDELAADYSEVYLIGDASKPRKFIDANREAYSVANAL